jgi:capsular polysaccharide biosynthesis protein
MEFKEYLQIVKEYKKVFLATWGIVLFLPLFTVFVQPTIYDGEKTMFISRGNINSEISVSEEYDYYYQLEADKKFAGIMVKLLKDKSLLERVFSNNKVEYKNTIDKIAISAREKKWVISNLEGEVLGGGYVKIKISSHNKELAKQIGERLVVRLSDRMSKVSIDKNRLIELSDEPMIITQKSKAYFLVAVGAFFGGLLIAIFLVLGIYYWEEE